MERSRKWNSIPRAKSCLNIDGTRKYNRRTDTDPAVASQFTFSLGINMKSYHHLVLAGVFLVSMVPSLAGAQDMPATSPSESKAEPDVDEISVNTGSKEDFDQVCQDAGITGEQLDKIHELAVKRMERLKAWAESADGRKYIDLRKEMAATRRARSAQLKKTQSATQPVDFDAKVAEINAVMRPLGRQYTELRNSTRGEILKELSPAQQEKAVATNLNRRLSRMLAPANPTAEQNARIQAIADEYAKEYLKKQTLDQDPLMQKLLGLQNSAAKKIRDEVLTEAQREELAKPRRRTPATTQSAS